MYRFRHVTHNIIKSNTDIALGQFVSDMVDIHKKIYLSNPLDLSPVPRPSAAVGDREEPESDLDEHPLQHQHAGASPALTGGGGRYALPSR